MSWMKTYLLIHICTNRAVMMRCLSFRGAIEWLLSYPPPNEYQRHSVWFLSIQEQQYRQQAKWRIKSLNNHVSVCDARAIIDMPPQRWYFGFWWACLASCSNDVLSCLFRCVFRVHFEFNKSFCMFDVPSVQLRRSFRACFFLCHFSTFLLRSFTFFFILSSSFVRCLPWCLPMMCVSEWNWNIISIFGRKRNKSWEWFALHSILNGDQAAECGKETVSNGIDLMRPRWSKSLL